MLHLLVPRMEGLIIPPLTCTIYIASAYGHERRIGRCADGHFIKRSEWIIYHHTGNKSEHWMSQYRSQRSIFPVVYIFQTGSNHPCEQLIYFFQGGRKYMASIVCTLEAPEFQRRSVWQKYQQVRSTTKR